MHARPTIALSARWDAYPARFRWAAEHRFALEYTPNPDALHLLPVHLAPFVEAGIPVRHHAFFPGYEIAHGDPILATRAVDLHLAALDAIEGWGEPVVTVHIGLRPQDPVDSGQAVRSLAQVVERGKQLGITVSLENLRRGPTSDPETVVAWASASGAMITLDVGHAVSCQRVQAGLLSPLAFVSLFASRLIEAHIYGRETDRHHPPEDMTMLGPIVDCLLETSCTWWTIELDDLDEALTTRALLLDYVPD